MFRVYEEGKSFSTSNASGAENVLGKGTLMSSIGGRLFNEKKLSSILQRWRWCSDYITNLKTGIGTSYANIRSFVLI